MEAEAVIYGIQVAQQTNCMPSIIESDCKEVVELSMSKRSSRTEICWNIEEIQAKLKNQNCFSIQLVPRKCNAMAHSIAKVALDFENSIIWTDDFPVQIMLLLSNLNQ